MRQLRTQSNLAMATQAKNVDVWFPPKMRFLFEPWRYKVPNGGRGAGAKSWSIARALLLIGKQPDLLWPGWSQQFGNKGIRVLCFRETMRSIEESVHQTLTDQIALMHLSDFYQERFQKHIIGKNGTEFFFAGVRQSVDNLKSYEAVDIAWGSQAEAFSKRSLNIVMPTIRKDIVIGDKKYESEIWFDFNPEFEDDPVYKIFVKGPAPDNAFVQRLYSEDNPWFTGTLSKERDNLMKRDPEECAHVFGGELRSTVEGAVYKKEMRQAVNDKRITRVPWESAVPVNTFWDIGPAHARVWLAQSVGFEFRFIDFVADEMGSLATTVKQLKERPYIYGSHHLPWDAGVHEYGSGRSVQEQLTDTFGKEHVRVVRKLSVEDGIAAARAIFPKCWFDSEKCEVEIRSGDNTQRVGLHGLRCYQYEYDQDRKTFGRNPLHDWASHDADAFRTAAVSIREAAPAQNKPKPVGSGVGVIRGIRNG